MGNPRACQSGVGRLLAAGLFLIAALALPAQAGARRIASSDSGFTALSGSVTATSDRPLAEFHSYSMTIEVALAPTHQAQLKSLLGTLYDRKSSDYRHWLSRGEFLLRFGPSSRERLAVERYLRAHGMVLERSSSPFFVRAAGSSDATAAAFRTDLRTYRDRRGISYFSNATAVRLPAGIARGVTGVIGLSNTIRDQAGAMHNSVQRGLGRFGGGSPSCETPYPSVAELANAVLTGVNFPYGYGGGPGCSGLTPTQTNSIYDAPHAGPGGQGAGANLAVFELSAYQGSDIDTWAHQFYGRGYNPQLVNINVDGGPLAPVCPAGDSCEPANQAYAGDIEVDADIEMSLAIAPDVSHLLVYNAPNDETGQTELDEYTAIAKQDIASTVSSSWGVCENDAGAGYAKAENVVFEQLAAQGQSVFSSAGDTGAFDCIRDGTGNMVNVGDPSSQPWVTSVGGTSFDSWNPGSNPYPSYPNGQETVWNVDNLCNESANEDGVSGYDWCADSGAGGGGVSQFWGRPAYQSGPGVNNRETEYGNGTTQCAFARVGTPCREVPDISMNADEYTPYAEYCTGSSTTPGSVCATISTTPSGWFGIGGTSLSTPFMAAVIADRDGYTGRRTGSANEFLYGLFNSRNPSQYFHDINGFGQTPNSNGLFPVTPGYDMATGIGSAIMAPIITAGGYGYGYGY
jgi:subtilase family serine protease